MTTSTATSGTTTSSSPTYDPITTATALAKASVDGAQTLLTKQTAAATATASALAKLQSALSAFGSTVLGLAAKKSVVAHSATFSDSSVGTATAGSTAAPGTYSFFVEQLATAGQVAYANLAAAPVAEGGPLIVNLAGGPSFNVDLGSGADLDADGSLSPAEVATAINKASGNTSLVTASVITIAGQAQLVLSANATGAAGAIALDTSGLSGGLKTTLDAGSSLVTAQDAIVWLGAQTTGIKLQQASNTYTAVTGVSMTFNKVMATGTAPVTLKVATDTSATVANVQSFVDAYNTLETALDGMTSSGDAANGVAASAFASDSAVSSLRSRIASTLRLSTGGLTLANYGVSADRYGQLSLDQSRLNAKLVTSPVGLDSVLGKTGIGTSSGVFGGLDVTMNQWINGTTGQIKHRQDGVKALQTSLTARQTTLDDRYNSSYKRYLAQFTALQTLQAQMAQTTSLFNALYSSTSN